MKNEKKCIVMLSGGLDSRLAVKIMQEQNFNVIATYFKLPFGCSYHIDVGGFAEENGCELKIFDCTKGRLLQEYLDCIKHPKYNRGTGVNPCIDCKIFLFKKAKEFADEEGIDLVVSGEVLGERPMSQMKKAMDIIEDKSGLKDRLLRPLSAKLLHETDAEKNGIVDRDKLYGIEGRRRNVQIELAEKFKINYPSPAGGCLLCERALKNRFKILIERGINDSEVNLVGIGRHFMINGNWVILGRNENENEILEELGKKFGELIVSEIPGPSALIMDKSNQDVRGIVEELMSIYSKKENFDDRKKFEKWKL